ncbi:MAG TPA: hypothetical protein VJY37_02320 [Anaerovoracaceae bacterium]|nr:hypothetical protein [Anaerovoracaceae bacterium]
MMKYEGVATLGVNLNRQKYGPLDVSSVLLTLNDLKAYCTGDASAMSEGWTGGTPYPYPGQIIVVLENNTAYQLYDNEGAIAYRTMIDLSVFYTKEDIDEMLSNVSVDMSGYYTKEQVDSLIGAIEGTGETVVVEAMSTDDILAAIGAASGGVPVTPSGQILDEMSAEDVRTIIKG